MKDLHINKTASLKRCFGMRESVTITVGTVIGVGLFTVGSGAAGILGPAVIFATLTALIISIYPALIYAEMGGALPFAGGTYQYASLGLGRPFGMLAGWNFIISMVSVASGEALAFSFYLRTLFEALGFSLPFSDPVIASAAILLFVVLAVRGVEMSGRLQNGFLFFFWGITIIWFITMLPVFHLDSFSISTASDSLSIKDFFPCVAMIWWCFAGFETCCAMGEEICFPRINLPRALFLAPFIVFIVTALFQWALVSITPVDSLAALATADAPYAHAMKTAGIVGLPLILLCLGITFGGDFSTLNAAIAAPARYLFTMARDNAIPPILGRIHPRFQSPFIALICLGLLMILLVSTGSITYIASLSLFATLLYYVIGMLSALGLRKKYPDLSRPFRTPGLSAGAGASIAVYLLLMTQLSPEAIAAGIMWSLAGLVLFFARNGLQKNAQTKKEKTEFLFTDHEFDVPSDAEQAKMDREYRIWRLSVICAIIGVGALYLFSFVC
ncbi:APC family permease [Ihubacter massiliensis]|uniref:APC family permease n=1 Tax=Hominibacterium faecale TaxID=2839743 RepID=A0A9J6QX15_9FIRM|nr:MULTISPECIES: APC family permease [Eubacteriales Family XIII. Incertae Sedis]MCC2865077.1 APC family permease [Anaerovorax odorimutans]MCO7120738.1 APC family permease [Ihubacter massiliensis]MCU7380039.1 APC family permease [Hominibacterium faecale]